eukprot:4931337-Pyramimonas_sp.AAC.1
MAVRRVGGLPGGAQPGVQEHRRLQGLPECAFDPRPHYEAPSPYVNLRRRVSPGGGRGAPTLSGGQLPRRRAMHQPGAATTR